MPATAAPSSASATDPDPDTPMPQPPKPARKRLTYRGPMAFGFTLSNGFITKRLRELAEAEPIHAMRLFVIYTEI